MIGIQKHAGKVSKRQLNNSPSKLSQVYCSTFRTFEIMFGNFSFLLLSAIKWRNSFAKCTKYLLTSRYQRRGFFLPICYADFMFHLLAMKIVVKILHFLTRSWYMNKVQCVHKFCFFVQKKHNRAKLFWKEHSFFHKPLWFSTNVFNFQHSILIHAYYEF